MTPKEKAKELFARMEDIPDCDCNPPCDCEIITVYQSKQCALIAVDEILSLLPLANRDYWQEVKQELEKL